MDNKIDKIRNELDEIDDQLIKLFEKRMRISDEVAKIKLEDNIGLTDDTREKNIIDKAISLVNQEYKGETIAYIRSLMGLSKIRQRKVLLDLNENQQLLPPARKPISVNVKIAYQGLPGAWGEQAAIQFFGESDKEPLERFEDVFIAVKEKRYHYGVVPIENSQTGAIGEVYDLLRNYGCYIVGQTWVQAKHCLLGIPGTKLENIREVFSHPEGFRQCDGYLKKFAWDLTACRNTAVAAKMVSDRNSNRFAAIGSRRAAEINGLDIIVPDIMDDDKNQTRFIIIADTPEYNENSDTVSIIFRTAHRSGALCDVLFPLMAEEVNLTRIESRPMSGGKYCFFTDLKGNITDSHVASAISHAASVCGFMEVLGCYSENSVNSERS